MLGQNVNAALPLAASCHSPNVPGSVNQLYRGVDE